MAKQEKHYYKYQSLSSLKYVLEAVYHSRLYGARRQELNDPMEGKFDYTDFGRDDFKEINRALKYTRICSLQAKGSEQSCPDDFLMWSHYGGQHHGCCIELSIPSDGRKKQGWVVLPVKYSDALPPVQGELQEKITTILSCKSEVWKYEREVRAIYFQAKHVEESKNADKKRFLSVHIKAVYLGARLSIDECRFYKALLLGLNPEIKVYRMREEKTEDMRFFPLTAEAFE